MGRWRPPRPASSPYITPEGFARLQVEVKELWVRRRDVVKALAAAAAEGDRSENAEYIYRKKELGGIDRRINYLQKRLPVLNVIRRTPNPEQVFFGATVTVERDDGSEVSYRIVGADEADSSRGDISLDSPVARALLKKFVDDEVSIQIAEQTEVLLIRRIQYGT